ncbi:hypothetical protein ADL27_49115 [Streptomyces sp. NRRL F-6602]|nr:hypothetical protein ADL27_49115 [Streptomyces sp. NRRL F-6602]
MRAPASRNTEAAWTAGAEGCSPYVAGWALEVPCQYRCWASAGSCASAVFYGLSFVSGGSLNAPGPRPVSGCVGRA